MPLDAVSNFVRGETDSSLTNSDTTVSVNDASIFPDPATEGEYNVVIWDVADHPRPDQDPDVEVLRVTAIDTTNNDLTVTRGQEATTGASHPSGSAVHLSPTAKMFGDIETTFNAFYDDTNDVLTSQVGTAASPVSGLYGDSVDANSVSTGQLAFDDIGSSSAKTLYNADETDGDNQLQKNIKYTFGVSTSADTILSPTSSDFFVAAKVTVLVREATSVYALDEVMMLSDGTATSNSTLERNNPASRTYSVANNTDLQLELDSSTANVVAVGELLDINKP